MRQELRRLNSPNRVFHQATKLLALFVADGGPQVLNLDQALSDEYHLCDFRNASDPGIANELRIQGQQSFGFFGVSA